MDGDVRAIPGGSTVAARVRPRSRPGMHRSEQGLVVGVGAAPVGGRANEEAMRVVADALGVPASAVSIRMGRTARTKVFEVRGLAPEDVRQRLRDSLED